MRPPHRLCRSARSSRSVVRLYHCSKASCELGQILWLHRANNRSFGVVQRLTESARLDLLCIDHWMIHGLSGVEPVSATWSQKAKAAIGAKGAGRFDLQSISASRADQELAWADQELAWAFQLLFGNTSFLCILSRICGWL